MKVFLQRHGETKLLIQGHILRGSLDDPLTAKGWEQMQTAFDGEFSHQHWQAIISSPLSRCANFAKSKADEHGLPLLTIDELSELNFGDWEGKFTADLFAQFPNQMATWWQSPTQFTPPNGESIADFAKRIDKAFIKIEQFAKENDYQRLCVICHGGVIKYLYCKAQQLSLDEILKQPAELGEFHQFGLENGQLSLS